MKIALVGNQNCGKTTLFNLLTGMNQKIGNWPGVTVEKKFGIIKDSENELVDLPGVYSLTPYSEEERITRDFILNKQCDLIINVIDVSCIERSLYLTTQLLEVDVPVIVVLNMADLLDKKGIKVDVNRLATLLGVKVVKVSALKNIGVEELKQSFEGVKVNSKKIFSSDIESSVELISESVESNKRFISLKILENDLEYLRKIENNTELLNKIRINQKEEMDSVIADQRYKYISELKKECFVVEKRKVNISEKLDKVFLNKWFSLPIFAFIMFGIYYLSVGVIGSATVDLVDAFVGSFGDEFSIMLEKVNTSPWLISLIVDGIIAGVGAVLNFIPQLIILFMCISLLETSGYMARISFFLDMVFKKFGLSGKTLVPFIVGSGCSVPGIMATRTIENKDEREMAIVLTPFIPCSAKLPIIALFAEFFFPNSSGLVSASLYFLSILVILLLSLLLKKFIYRNESNSYISELPEYKLPSLKYVFKDVMEKVFSFIKRAGSVILVASIVIWVLLSFSWRFEYGVEVENSILASIGKSFSWVFYPMLGEFSWEATVSAVQGLVAKEQVVGSMAVIGNMSEDTLSSISLFTSSSFGFFTSASAYAYVVFNLFSAPCFGAIGAMKKEFGSLKKTLLAVLLQCVVAWVISVLIYIIGTLIIGG